MGACIVQRAREWPADLIVCGTHGRRGVRRLLLGSDAEYILRHTPVPILLVRASE
ncbi:MAG: universal stress protein [Steroidobacteraceae bacterium]